MIIKIVSAADLSYLIHVSAIFEKKKKKVFWKIIYLELLTPVNSNEFSISFNGTVKLLKHTKC